MRSEFSEENPMLDLFKQAKQPHQQADILLRLPAKLLCDEHDALIRACKATGFDLAENYIYTFCAMMNATRKPNGGFNNALAESQSAMASQLRGLANQALENEDG